MPPPASARLIALDVLDRVLGAGRPLDDTFAGHPALARLDGRDRAFARLLVTTVLRRLGQIDVLLEGLMRARPKAIRVHNLLRLGVAQLLFLGTPAHAAVAEMVALARGSHHYARSLINAVLRRVAREGKDRLAQQDAARLNTPDWLWQSWTTAYGERRHRGPAGLRGRSLVGAGRGGRPAGAPARRCRRARGDRPVRRARGQDGAAGRGRRPGERGRAVRPESATPAYEPGAP
jgi:transcription termination factor NusB